MLQANRLPRARYAVAVLPADDINAFACGGHLVIVTSYALDTLPRDELAGVLAHELSHHLGLHTVALTISQWLNLPVLLLARIGVFLQNVATAATDTFARDSASLTAVGRLIAGVLRAVSWVFLAGLLATNAIANVVGRNAEFQADRRVVEMGFGRPLANALRRVMTTSTPARRAGNACGTATRRRGCAWCASRRCCASARASRVSVRCRWPTPSRRARRSAPAGPAPGRGRAVRH